MQEIVSSNVKLRKPLTINQIVRINQMAKAYDGTIYLLGKGKIINMKYLPKLVSFLLTVDPGQEFKIIVEGTNVQETILALKECCITSLIPQYMSEKRLVSPALKIKI